MQGAGKRLSRIKLFLFTALTDTIRIPTIAGDILLLVNIIRTRIHIAKAGVAPPITDFFPQPSVLGIFLPKLAYS